MSVLFRRLSGSIACVLIMSSAAAQGRIAINTDTGTFEYQVGDQTIVESEAFNGTPFDVDIADGLAVFTFHGDLVLDGVFDGVGRNGAVLRSTNNLTLTEGSVINFSARDDRPGPGGGAGGASGEAGKGGAGGAGGAGGVSPKTPTQEEVFAGRFRNYGDGGFARCDFFSCTRIDGADGRGPVAGAAGTAGAPGSTGGRGGDGADGVNGGVGGAGGAAATGAGAGAAAGAGGRVPTVIVGGGPDGSGGGTGFRASGGSNLGGNAPVPVFSGRTGADWGRDGAAGGTGGRGGAGLPGADGGNFGSGPTISGGGGGGAGGGGAGGGGSGGGGGGASGGGGGGGGALLYDGTLGRPARFAPGGEGGAGGDGGSGANGGKGGDGGLGGAGGGGGGAIALEAAGRLTVLGVVNAQGAPAPSTVTVIDFLGPFDSRAGRFGRGGIERGPEGRPGEPGESGTVLNVGDERFQSGAGGDGTDGRRGGGTGAGGLGGDGGRGGNGAGGSIRLSGSVVTVDDEARAVVDGGNRLNREEMDNAGRIILAENAATPTALPPPSGREIERYAGPTDRQPFLTDRVVRSDLLPFPVLVPYTTPLIPDLVGGAETFGLLSGIDARDPFFAPHLSGLGADNLAALLRLDRGPGPLYDVAFAGHDWLFFLNLGDDPLATPRLGVDPEESDEAFLRSLRLGGWTRDPAQGGGGDETLAELAGLSVFAMLVPEDGTLFNFAGAGLSRSGLLGVGDSLALRDAAPAPIPLPVSGWMLLAGIAALFGLRGGRYRHRRG